MRTQIMHGKAGSGGAASGRDPALDAVLDDPELRRGILVAFRLSATFDEAPSRCPRRDCRRLGRCRAQAGKDGEPECRAGIGDHVVDRAADMLAFLTVLPKPEWRG